MSKRRHTIRHGKSPSPPTRKEGIPRVKFIVLMILVAAGLGFGAWKLTHSKTPPAPEPSTKVSENNPRTVAAVANPEFQKLNGKWQRPDGGYVVEVKGVDNSGKMDVSYFNPKSIHVSKAQASREGTSTKVFIELRDVNYPGSTYNLIYDPKIDQLQGIYYQAALQQSYEVFFTRIP
jgi:hypothetical protein